MEYTAGKFLPKIAKDKCKNCYSCSLVCPGIDFMPGCSGSTGDFMRCYTAYARDFSLRKKSTSGGVATKLAAALIKNREYDAAFVLDFDIFDNKPARLTAASSEEAVYKSAKSKYVPASVYNVIKTLEENKNKKYIIIATPCQLLGIKKYLQYRRREENIPLFLGLFCDKTMNFNFIRYFNDICANTGEKLIKFEYRAKEAYGYPGGLKLLFDSGRSLTLDKKLRMEIKDIFQLERCLLCTDKLNCFSDISLGDCYIENKADPCGKSSVIVRTKKGSDILDKYADLFVLEKEDMSEIIKSQSVEDKQRNMKYAMLYSLDNGLGKPDNLCREISKKSRKRLKRSLKAIRLSERYDICGIKITLFKKNLAAAMNKNLRRVKIAVILLFSAAAGLFKTKKDFNLRSLRDKKDITIGLTGGELYNKGSQAMVFTVVGQIKKTFSQCSVYLFSGLDYTRPAEQKNIYAFKIMPWNLKIKADILNPFKNKACRDPGSVKSTFKKLDFIVDISGYCLSSQFNSLNSLDYLSNIIAAKRFSIPYYIFPQSMGPFDYKFTHKLFLYPLMRLLLPYPEKIFVREAESVNTLSAFRRKNVKIKHD
ncbi:MAG: Coenzyme F420 hydrogenase/dehydrogenase, beta subunit C-terminal domain, partial [Candidatus Omnitrophica bacterium]|nr:Coenzyme F420 hydrogenase/dehydrogenase, beta subunit C-terminal domain [Candidatus Omnitrophota bacterium]